eukprot:CAMPEP_0197001608 /NCGR_PEP_ID=MMETSP1380-20130617/6268_1 /TAXON_ID=5936 /ORGANISM="Euplotes crassus, Strain CT5" /LENGTH=348 /DNA_ID=CAMNT_0042419343 /DNA_START=165 /DNA_END=1208 /DNA_ORIENTATION=-
MAKIVETVNNANIEREQATNELADLIKQAEQEKKEFDEGINNINAKIAEEKAKKESLKQKEQELIHMEKVHKEARQAEEEYAQKQNRKNANGYSSEKVQCLIPQEKLNEYQEAFKKIAESTKVKDIDELVKNFIEAEERNFSLSKFVEELTQESEELDTKIEDIKEEIEMYKNQGLGYDNEKKKLQKELEEKIAENEKEYQKNLIEYQNSVDKINNIKQSIDEIFDLVDNETSKKYKEMSKSMGTTHDNIMSYLGMVEEMINDMIKQYAYYLAQNLKANNDINPSDPTIVTLNNILMVAPKTDYGSIKNNLEIPSDQLEAHDVDEDIESVPLSFEKLQKIAENKHLSG